MERQPIFVNLNERPRFGMGTVIAIYGNAARNLQGLGRCIAAAAIGGSFGPFSADRERETKFFMIDTLSNEFETREATEAILDMAESSEALPEGIKVGHRSAISCQCPEDIRELITQVAQEANPDILIISGAEDIPQNAESLAELRAAFRRLKKIAWDINGIVILEFGMDPTPLIKTALIDNCHYAFHTREDKNTGQITVTPTKWDEPIPAMYIDTDPEEAPTITLDEVEL